MTETKKDYSLLRPFDLEAAKSEYGIIDTDWDAVRYIGASSKFDEVCVEQTNGDLLIGVSSDFRMAPLCWVEGKPVYKGDVLYGVGEKKPLTAELDGLHWNHDESQLVEWRYASGGGYTWAPPKVKREVKLLAFIDDRKELRWVREDIFGDNQYQRIPSEDKLIQFEE